MKTDPVPVPFQNLLVIRPRYLGDLVLATGLASVAKAVRPQARVTFLADAHFAEILRHHPDIDQVLPFETERKNSPFYLWEFLRGLRRQKFDCVLDLFGNPRTAQWTFLSGAPVRVGYRLRGRSWAYNRLAEASSPVLSSGRRPVTEAFLDQWRALGYGVPGPYRTSLHVLEQERVGAGEILVRQGWKAGEPLAAFFPGASHPAKHWPLEKFVELARRLAGRGYRPLFLTGPKDREVAAKLEGMAGGERWLKVPEPSLRPLAALINLSALLVSNDAGPMHLGPAVGTPTVGIFGPGEPEIWFPYGLPHQAAYREIHCSHCRRDVCPVVECMEALAVDDVEQACLRALKTQ